MRTRGRFILVTAVAIAAASLLNTPASASKVENDTDEDVVVWFDCGMRCGFHIPIKAGATAGKPGQAGNVSIEYAIGGKTDDTSAWRCEEFDANAGLLVGQAGTEPAEVAALGTIVASARDETDGEFGAVLWKAYDDDGNLAKQWTHQFDEGGDSFTDPSDGNYEERCAPHGG